MIRQIFLSALISGFIAGIFLTGIQSLKVTPLILAAEVFEDGELITYTTKNHNNSNIQKTNNHHDEKAHVHDNSHEHETGAHDNERLFYSLITNIFLACGFAFILSSIYLYIKELNIRNGLISGFVVYLCVFALPSLGLSPELPGTLAAQLQDRQIWWVSTVVLSSFAFIILFFNKNKIYQALSIILLFLPHIIGAPMPNVHGGTAPQAMFEEYILVTYITNAFFWLFLGAISISFFKRFQEKII